MDEPRVFAALVHGLMRFGRALGVEEEALAAASGLSAGALDDQDARVPFSALTGLWRLYTTRFPDAPLGLMMAQGIDYQEMGLLGQLVMTSPDVRTSLDRVVRFTRLIDPLMELEIVTRDGQGQVLLEHDLRRVMPPDTPEVCEPMEMIATSMCYHVYAHATHASLNRDDALVAVEMAHARRHPAAVYEARFMAPVRFGRPTYRIIFDAAILDATFPQANPQAGRYVERYAHSLLSALPAPQPTTVGRLRGHLEGALADGEVQQEEAARALGMSTRTLQRRLRGEGTSFSEVLDEVRRRRALELLRDAELAVYEVAYLLGYQDATSFYRAFRRWTEQTPEQLRRAWSEEDARDEGGAR